MEKEKVDEIVKELEKASETTIPSDCAYIVRLDGVAFSTFTSGFKSPFDENFSRSMILTMNDLLDQFPAMTGYTHSDEITLIIPAVKVIENKVGCHMFNGRIQKICSVLAGLCSARFNYHIVRLMGVDQSYKPTVLEKVNDQYAHFDARVLIFNTENLPKIVSHMIFRSVQDCHRNCVSTYARSYFSAKQLKGKKTKEMLTMMAEKGFKWEEVPMYLKHGVYGKKVMYETEAENKKTGEKVKAMRTKIINKCFRVFDNGDFVDLFLAKYWPEVVKVDGKDLAIADLSLALI
jgi:tRNA(His) guanylyltransferase